MLKKALALMLFSGLLLTFGYIAFANPANPVVLMKTSKGDITVELNAEKASITVKNFLSYVDDKFYDGTIFHRVIKGFMIQGGGLTPDFHEKATKSSIKNEAANGLKNLRGTIAMARTPDINSATSQFFINHVDNAFLDYKDDTPEGYGYAVFGKVIKGIEVVDAIANVPTGTIRGYQDAPRETVTILSITRVGK
jgi:cyclophilin family peptidyl-prolyl cis-trans isomerase